MGDEGKHVVMAVQEQQTTEFTLQNSVMCFSSKINTKLLFFEETKQQMIIIPQQQTIESENRSQLCIGYIDVKIPKPDETPLTSEHY